MVLETIERLLPAAFIVLALLWLLSAAYILVDRWIYELSSGRVRRAARALAAGSDLRAEVDEISFRTLEQVAADTATPNELARALAASLVERRGRELYRERARTRYRGLRKSRRLTALSVLFHADDPDVLELLEEALASDDADVVGASVAMLGRTSDVRAAGVLVDALIEQRYAASRIATHLDHFPSSIETELAKLLPHPDPMARFWGVTLLARYGAAQRVAELAHDGDERVRKAVSETLGAIGDEASAPVLARLVEDESWVVRAHAARALASLGRVEDAEKIAPLLADREWWVRLAAKESLVELGDGVVPIVKRFLDHGDRFARNGAAEVLQNLGWIDQLMDETLAGRGDADDLRRVLAAGGSEMARAVCLRRETDDQADAQALVESVGLRLEGDR